jgi:hypothetical protein
MTESLKFYHGPLEDGNRATGLPKFKEGGGGDRQVRGMAPPSLRTPPCTQPRSPPASRLNHRQGRPGVLRIGTRCSCVHRLQMGSSLAHFPKLDPSRASRIKQNAEFVFSGDRPELRKAAVRYPAQSTLTPYVVSLSRLIFSVMITPSADHS